MPAHQPSKDQIINALHLLGLHLPTTVADVGRAHRELSKAHHPDRLRGTAQKARGTEHMKAINAARAYLMEHLAGYLASTDRHWTRHRCVYCCAAYADIWPLDPRD